MLRNERWVILLSFVAAAIITPTPDPLNQLIIALPIIIIYQLGIILVAMSIRSGKKQLKKAAKLEAKLAKAAARQVNPKLRAAAAAVVADVAPVPVAATAPTAAARHARPVRSVDGFVSRRPVRPIARPLTPAERQAATSAARPANSLIDDVIRAAVRPASAPHGPIAA
jgi:hypothetical protein